MMTRFLVATGTVASLLLTPLTVHAQAPVADAAAAVEPVPASAPMAAAPVTGPVLPPAPRATPPDSRAPAEARSTARSTQAPVTPAVALRARTATVHTPAPRVPRANTGQNRALVVVGAVGIAVGALVGDDAGTIIMLGSAGVGLVGLYRLLN